MSETVATIVGLTAVIVAVTDEVPRVLAVRQVGDWRSVTAMRCRSGRSIRERQRTLDSGLRRLVAEQTGLDLRYVEQLYTFGDRDRDPCERDGGTAAAVGGLPGADPGTAGARQRRCALARLVRLPAVGGLALRPAGRRSTIRSARHCPRWIEEAADAARAAGREERVGICFGLAAAPWDPVRDAGALRAALRGGAGRRGIA